MINKKKILEKFQEHAEIDGIIVVCVKDWINYMKEMQFRYRLDKIAKIVPGGKTGQLSIYAGLKAAEDIFGVDDNIVLIHDGVRPLIGKQIISDNIESVKKYGSAVTCAPTKESVVLIDEKNNITEVVERNESRTAKAPESFYLKDILTGATGLIGSSIVKVLENYNVKIVAVVRNIEKAKKILGKYTNIDYLNYDIVDIPIENMKIDYVIHAAANTSKQYY